MLLTNLTFIQLYILLSYQSVMQYLDIKDLIRHKFYAVEFVQLLFMVLKRMGNKKLTKLNVNLVKHLIKI